MAADCGAAAPAAVARADSPADDAEADGADCLLRRYPQVTQATDFDCGLACLRMTLRGLPWPYQAEAAAAEAALEAAIVEAGLGSSLWSPDLLYLLMRCGVAARLCSCCLEPKPEYAKLNYYSREFSSDQQRVTRHLSWIRARDPAAALQQAVPLEAILDHLGRRLGPIVCLIDSNKTEAARLQACLDCSGCLTGSGSYQGHYILLCGFSRQRSKVFYRNPMRRDDRHMSMSFRELEVARKAYGTDEDLIFVFEQTPGG